MSLHAIMSAHSPAGRTVKSVVKLLHSSEPYSRLGYRLIAIEIPFLLATGQVLGVVVSTLFTEVHKFSRYIERL